MAGGPSGSRGFTVHCKSPHEGEAHEKKNNKKKTAAQTAGAAEYLLAAKGMSAINRRHHVRVEIET